MSVERYYFCTLGSPIGDLVLVSNGEALIGLHLESCGADLTRARGATRDDSLFVSVREQLEAYFHGERTDFDLVIELEGSSFQRRVWQELRQIPFGTTISYAELARRVGKPSAARAVGGANGRNPIAIIVPCHRVISADGSLGGYGGGLERKLWLLDHERFVLARRVPHQQS